MMNLANRRHFPYRLGILLCFGLFFAMANGCTCGSTPPPVQDGKKADGGVTDKKIKDTLADKKNPDPTSNTCKVRCDCPQGQECSEGTCVTPPVPVYCCEKAGCPQGVRCEKNNGISGVCGIRKKCNRDCDCEQGLGCVSGYCTKTDKAIYCCEKRGCPLGKVCSSEKGGKKICGGEGSICSSACDCKAGLACNQGRCFSGTKPVYCCNSKTCPRGSACQTQSGSKGTCGGSVQCKSACDCQTGQACIGGSCQITSNPVYCCDRPKSCPEGRVCENSQAVRSKCPSQNQCKNHCDCPQGQACLNGKCIFDRQPVYCCENPKCPPKATCYSKSGAQSSCPGGGCTSNAQCGKVYCKQKDAICNQIIPQCTPSGTCKSAIVSKPGSCNSVTGVCQAASGCKTSCDCPQGLSCLSGQCIKSPRPEYCCSKPGCPSTQRCIHPSGKRSFCPTLKCKTDLECGKASCAQTPSGCHTSLPKCLSGKCVNNGRLVPNAFCQGATCVPRKPNCRFHCDCPQGLACAGGNCQKQQNPVFCCSKTGCPTNTRCYETNNKVNVCKKQPGCRSNAQCGRSACKQSGTSCLMSTPRCNLRTGQCTRTTGTLPSATCDNRTGTCRPTPPPICRRHCDCTQSLACIQGKCVKASGPVYCCEKLGCPTGNLCFKNDSQQTRSKCSSTPPGCRKDADCGKSSCRQSGSTCYQTLNKCDLATGRCRQVQGRTFGTCDSAKGQCGTLKTCKVHCDCPQGQACARVSATASACVVSRTPVYCCKKKGCPSKQSCFNQSNQISTCPQSCKTPCGCSAGQDCLGNVCTAVTAPVYCCNNTQQCPAGSKCRDKQNKAGVCSKVQRKCKTPCDCVQGEGCVSGFCQKTAAPTYCCSKSGCASGKACTDQFNNKKTCALKCKEVCDCPQGQACYQGICQLSGQAYCCDKPDCPSGAYCIKKGGTSSGRCPIRTCKSACDCTQGSDCFNGFCRKSFPAVYCCSKGNCPSGKACKKANNKWGTCPKGGGCKSPCDCPQGQDCYKGLCIRVSPPIYCCNKANCQPGYACTDSSGKTGICPGQQCKTACDCPRQGYSCVKGRCAYTNPPTFCCSKPNCRAGYTCENKQGKLSVCPRPKCKTSCDCAQQGQACVRGSCVNASPRIYCCSKPGCYPGQACENKSGSSSYCPGTRKCKVACDCQQGEDCRNGICARVNPRVLCCGKPGCRQGNLCRDAKDNVKGCFGTRTCKTACDCSSGRACQKGYCVYSGIQVYCCSSSNCRSGQTCQKKDGSFSTCPVQCKNNCDCKQGYACSRGTCFRSSRAFCCDKPGCPTGSICMDKNSRVSTCGGVTGGKCTVRCNCPQGEECLKGKCTRMSSPVFCCSKGNCPRGFLCKDKVGKDGVCSGNRPFP